MHQVGHRAKNMISGIGRRATSTLSVAMIVRDEAEHLSQALDNFSHVADEICVVDTGSKDRTLEIAQAHGCTIGQFEWCDDFSAARNASLGLCTSDWIFVLDADERIDPEDIPAILDFITQAQDTAYRFITRTYTNTSNQNDFEPSSPQDEWAQGFPGWCPSRKVRLFPNHPEAAFTGRVHELIHESLESLGLSIKVIDIPIHHYAETKSAKSIARKRAFYARLGEQKIEEHPNNADLHAELGHQYLELAEYHKATKAYRRAVALEPSHAPWLENLGGALYLIKRIQESENALGLALKLDPNLADAWRNLAAVKAEQGEYDRALAHIERAIAINPGRAEFMTARAVLLARAGRSLEALESAEAALLLHPESQSSLDIYLDTAEALDQYERAHQFLSDIAQSGRGTREMAEEIKRIAP